MAWDNDHILERLQKAIGDGKCAGPIADPEIAAAETTLGVRFPTSYRLFLKHFGAAWLPSSYEIAGHGPGRSTDLTPPLWVHVIDLTLSVRRTSRGFIPHDYVRFGGNGGDFAFYLASGNADANGECPVVVLGPGREGIIAISFVDFVERAVAGQLII